MNILYNFKLTIEVAVGFCNQVPPPRGNLDRNLPTAKI